MGRLRWFLLVGLVVVACGPATATTTAAVSSPSSTPVSAPSPNVSPTPPFVPSPAVRDPRWPAGGPVPAALAGGWMQKVETFPMYLGSYTMEFGPIAANAVVKGSTIYFISDTCTPSGTYGYDTYHFTITGDTLVLTRVGAWNCGWRLQSTFTRLAAG
jgi:hypothetical protein